MRNEDVTADVVPTGVHGWGCTPTGDQPPTTIPSEDNSKPNCMPAFKISWKRNTLYAILAFLIILVFINLALTLWIVSALKLSMNGIGPIKIIKGGFQLDGQAWITDRLVTSLITSRPAQPVTVHTYRNFSVLVSKPNNIEYSKLLIKKNSVQCSGHTFELRDALGTSLFHASRDEVRISADTLAVNGAGGVIVDNALQVPAIHAPPGSDLRLESLTRRLDLMAPQSINLTSRAGAIDVISHSTISLNSVAGAIKFDSANVIINNLKEANMTNAPSYARNIKIYQLCVCASGKLFLAASDAACVQHNKDVDLCR